MNDDIKKLLPQHKTDWRNADAITALGYPAVESVLPELIEWLQDYNWPVAQHLVPFLASIGKPIIPHVRNVLETVVVNH